MSIHLVPSNFDGDIDIDIFFKKEIVMNDLNSVYLVGKVVEDPVNEEGVVSFQLANQRCVYSAEDEEYHDSTEIFSIQLNESNQKKISKILVAGLRIGINGRLARNGSETLIIASTVQILESSQIKKK